MSQDFNDPNIKDPRPSSPVVPVRLGLDDKIQFRCRPGIACFNKCCQNINIMLTPYDILRLKNRLNVTSAEFLENYATSFEMDAHGMPGIRMKTKPGSSECQFLTPEGCGVYEDRPAACRYYALGATTMRAKESPTPEDFYFVVKEDHCLGHFEPRALTVREYRQEQGIEPYDEFTKEWRDIILKKRSSGPTVGAPSQKSMDLFYLASYDLDNFRVFIASPFFHDVYDIEPAYFQKLLTDEVELLQFAARYLKQVLYGEKFISEKPDAIEKRKKRREEISAKQREQMRKDMEKEIDAPE
ncbi:MAG: YkgJ family cysteine cluster protein [Gammaproteobacteria bacterium]|nr:YkgJ family cysteine cluster protein [Gammaproteobacteria bacterium]MDH3369991.1 YkgJ family cysteine cluster protein [Gammaproteobacteria bacterium]MDH3405699.1 YkgJ family cysteine cluster protein [Gammaproteobacteria bacterium]MDH3563137.1 YkgJ family cysteine cluster protein [Gammaproteobacteria bacterium]MDH5486870.1 YkgJ family cysteine cluster protein [Gammaproteobacteria bacterium]